MANCHKLIPGNEHNPSSCQKESAVLIFSNPVQKQIPFLVASPPILL